MNAPLIPCSGCQRHVRSTEASCPFCGLALAGDPRAEAPLLPRKRLKSLALMTFRAAAIGAALTACGGSGDDDDGAGGTAQGGRSGNAGASGSTDNPAGNGNGGNGGTTGLGGATFGGSPSDGGAIPIYRATPRG